ncbi:hypothetical protein KUCAC02_027800, partial [Chaenocephalus aceratus]
EPFVVHKVTFIDVPAAKTYSDVAEHHEVFDVSVFSMFQWSDMSLTFATAKVSMVTAAPRYAEESHVESQVFAVPPPCAPIAIPTLLTVSTETQPNWYLSPGNIAPLNEWDSGTFKKQCKQFN